MAEIVITEFMDAGVAERLKREFDVHWDAQLWDKPGELKALLRDATALIVRNRTIVDADLLAAGGALKVVGRLGVGLDNIDLATCADRGIEVCPAIGANAVTVAEYVIAAALILLRGPALRGTRRLIDGEWPREEFAGGSEISGKTLGIIGFGSIGQITGGRAAAMGLTVMAHDSQLPDDAPAWHEAERVTLDDLLARADIVTLHCPLTPRTRGLFDAERIAAMKPGAILINAARGGIVDEAACAGALKTGQLGGAALDCFDGEPIDKATGALFAGLPNVLLTPHIAGVTKQANRRISEVTVENVRRVLNAGV